jgi:hypothetical protein
MQEPYDERQSRSHRPRVMRRNPRGLVEALTGENAGQPLSFVSNFWVPTELIYREGNTSGVSTVAVPTRSGGV